MVARSLAWRAGLALVSIASIASLAGAQTKPPPLEKALAKKIATLGERWWKARPPTRFEEWDPRLRAEIEAEARALGSLPEGAASAVVELLWAPSKKLGPKGEVASGRMKLATPYGEAWCYLTAAGKNAPLLVGLHGGGAGAGSADEAQSNWAKKGCVGVFPQAIRLVDDAWNAVHGERFVLSLIEIAKVRYDVDPDRVYVAGFSMGGSGSWFLAGRHADLFAGAAPFAGVLMASPRSQLASKAEVTAIQHGLVPNVRNLAMWYGIGLEDKNCMPGTYLYVADVLDALRAADPGGYGKIHFTTYPDLAHEFAPGEPQAAFTFLFAEKRDTFPERVVWEYAQEPWPLAAADEPVARVQKPIFYWLGCREPVDRQTLVATRAANVITIEARNRARGVAGVTIFLNASMIDTSQEVVVRAGDAEVYRGKPAPDVWTVLQTLDDKLDRSLVFDRRIEL